MPGIFFIVVPLMIALFAVMAYLSHQQAVQRRNDLMRIADGLGWAFDPSSHSDWDDRFPQFGCFREGHSRSAYNLINGSLHIADRVYFTTLGDYTFKITTNNGKSSSTSTYHFSFAVVRLPFSGVPQLAVRPEQFFDGLGAFFGFDDIDFESAEFSRAYHVKSPDKRFAYNLIDPRMIEFLMAGKPRTFELAENVLCIYTPRRRWEPVDFPHHLDWCRRFIECWPTHVVANLTSLTPQ